MTIYVDLLFFINWIITYLLLAAAAVLMGQEVQRYRLLLGSMIGALYSAFMFFPEVSFLFWGGIRLLVSAGLVYISYRHRTLFGYLKMLFYFYIVSFVYGGGMYLFYSFTSAGANMVYSNGVYYIDMPLWLLLALAFVFYGIIRLVGRLQTTVRAASARKTITIELMGQRVVISAFVDTGNSLYDPVTLTPVIIVELSALQHVLPMGLCRAVEKEDVGALETLTAQHPKLKCRVIPYRGLGSGHQLLFALHPDAVIWEDGQRNTDILIGLTKDRLSAEGSYQALLHVTHN